MLSHYPRFRKGDAQGLVPKLGGLPWGLPADRWPVCEECGRPMSHLAQLPADPAVLPGVPDGEVLFAFKCEWDSVCSFWEVDGGANAVFTVPRQALADVPTPAPVVEDGTPEVLPELTITRWHAADDGAPAELEDAFYDYGLHSDLPDEIAHPHDWAGEWRTKAGGVPYWTANGAQQVPPGRLVLQIDNWVHLEEGGITEVANFCSDGTAYVFVDRSQTPPAYAMIINR